MKEKIDTLCLSGSELAVLLYSSPDFLTPKSNLSEHSPLPGTETGTYFGDALCYSFLLENSQCPRSGCVLTAQEPLTKKYQLVLSMSSSRLVSNFLI